MLPLVHLFDITPHYAAIFRCAAYLLTCRCHFVTFLSLPADVCRSRATLIFRHYCFVSKYMKMSSTTHASSAENAKKTRAAGDIAAQRRYREMKSAREERRQAAQQFAHAFRAPTMSAASRIRARCCRPQYIHQRPPAGAADARRLNAAPAWRLSRFSDFRRLFTRARYAERRKICASLAFYAPPNDHFSSANIAPPLIAYHECLLLFSVRSGNSTKMIAAALLITIAIPLAPRSPPGCHAGVAQLLPFH